MSYRAAEHLCHAVLEAVVDGRCETRLGPLVNGAGSETVASALHKLAHVHVSMYPRADHELSRRLEELEEREGPC